MNINFVYLSLLLLVSFIHNAFSIEISDSALLVESDLRKLENLDDSLVYKGPPYANYGDTYEFKTPWLNIKRYLNYLEKNKGMYEYSVILFFKVNIYSSSWFFFEEEIISLKSSKELNINTDNSKDLFIRFFLTMHNNDKENYKKESYAKKLASSSTFLYRMLSSKGELKLIVTSKGLTPEGGGFITEEFTLYTYPKTDFWFLVRNDRIFLEDYWFYE